MSDALVPDVLRALELAVIERLPNSTFHTVTPVPEWLHGAFGGSSGRPHSTLGEALPFLADFLPQAEGVWRQSEHATVESGPFVARVAGEDILLRASALTVGGRAVLVLERLTGIADPRAVLQRAREQLLEREQIVSQIAAMRPRAAAIQQAVEQLSGAALGDPERRLVESIGQAVADLGRTLSGLPHPPEKTSRSKGH